MGQPSANNDQSIENWRKRLIFRSKHRGTKEMDLIMGSFADHNISNFDSQKLQEYEEILTQNDPNLYNWLTGKDTPPKEIISLEVFHLLQQHKFA